MAWSSSSGVRGWWVIEGGWVTTNLSTVLISLVGVYLFAWLARKLPAPAKRAEVTYLLRGAGMSLGTRLSGLRIFATSWFTFRGGKYAPLAPASQLRRGVALGRPYAAVNFPSAEIVTAPAHLPLQEVRVWMAVSRRSAEIVVRAAPTKKLIEFSPRSDRAGGEPGCVRRRS